jgi:hypothetical protein
MSKNYEHRSRIQIYHEFDVKYDDPSAIDEVIEHATLDPEVFDYRCSDYAYKKLNEKPLCRVVKDYEETSWCGACGAAMTHVRPGKWQCDACDNLDVWMSAAKAMHGFLQSIEHGCADGRHKVDDEFLSRLQKFNLSYKNLCDPEEEEDP